MSDDTLDIVARELVLLFAPLADAVTQPVHAVRFFNDDTGQIEDLQHDPQWEMLRLLDRAGLVLDDRARDVQTAVTGLIATGRIIAGLIATIKNGQAPDVADLKSAVTDARTSIRTFSTAFDQMSDAPPPEDIVAALMEHLMARYLQDRHPAFWHGFCLLGITNANALRQSTRGQFDAKAIWPALSAPHTEMAQTVGWGGDLDHDLLFAHLDGLAEAFGLDVRLIDAPAHPFAPAQDDADHQALTLALPGFKTTGDPAGLDITLVAVVAALAQDGAAKEGLVAFLLATGKASFTADVGDTWQLTFTSDLDGSLPIGLVARPNAVSVKTPSLADAGSLKATLELGQKTPKISTWVEIGPLTLTAEPPKIRVIANAGKTSSIAIEAAMEKAKIALSPNGADGFLAKLIPKPLETEVPLTAGFDTHSGFYLQRGGGLAVDIPVGLGLGGILTVLSVGAALKAAQAAGGTDALDQVLALGVSGKAKLGPLGVSVEGIGVDLKGGLPTTADDIDALVGSFKPPTGIGLSLEAGPVTGGGYISRDPEKGQYVGALSLDLKALGLTAFGILDTKMPDEQDGFSLLVTVAGRFKPIPIGFGFTLNGVGGLLGLHRDIDIDVLREMTRAGTVGNILSPEDPIGDAATIAADASALFPVTRGQHVFGPSVKLGWGQPKQIVTLDLALALTLPDPLRLVLLGKVAVAVPDPKIPLVDLNMNVFGMIDFSARTLEAEGRLFDSKIQGLPVVGGFAVLTRWGDAPMLAFCVGGLHPAFEPPPGFPDLPRLGVDLSKGSFTLLIEGYFAVTSNSVQLGARAMLRAGAGGFSLHGELGFDALVIFDPFGVDLAIYARASVKRGSHNLCSVSVEGRLTGPGPWLIRGEATIEVLFFDIGVDFSVTIGAAERAPLSVMNLRDILIPALRDAKNWAGETANGDLVLDHLDGRVPPGAALEVRQKLLPLGLEIDKIGPNPLAGARKISLTGLTVGPTRLGVAQKLYDPFAPAQFFELSDGEKLGAPGYEPMPSGARFASANISATIGQSARVPSGRAAFIVETTDPSDPNAMRRVRASVVAPRIPDARRGVKTPDPTGQIRVTSESWTTTDDTLSGAQSGTGTSHAEARANAGQTGTLARTSEVSA